MTYLLDTNVLLFLYEDKQGRLSVAQRAVISNPANDFVLSEASLYELGIKIRQDRDDFRHITMRGIPAVAGYQPAAECGRSLRLDSRHTQSAYR